jgi:hypothetical protein
MRLYRPIKYELAERLEYAVRVSCGVVPAGVLILDREAVAMRMMNDLGACLVLELTPDFYKHAHAGGWHELLKEAPISEMLCKDVEQVLVDTAERKLLGLPDPVEGPRLVVRPLPPVAVRPDEKELKDFRTTHGRSPNLEELGKMLRRQ